jgi:hypothetical protein
MKYLLLLTLTMIHFVSGQTSMVIQSSRNLSTSFPPNPAVFTDKVKLTQEDFSGQPEKKNVTTAIVYSLLLPGMGELYAGNYSIGKYFTIAEGALWLTFGAYDWHATSLQDDARRFAVQHAQITINGKDDQYFVDIGEFQNVYDYNEQILRNREPEKLYNTSTSYWNWDNNANRQYFADLRVTSDERINDLRFVAAAIAVNHIVSAINAARIAIGHNNAISEAGQINIHANVIGGLIHPNGIMISLSKGF